jgi:hypothetical protein
VFDASSSGGTTAAVAVVEWEALAVDPVTMVLGDGPSKLINSAKP